MEFDNRVVRISVSRQIRMPKWALISLLEKMPEDTTFVAATDDTSSMTTNLFFHSKKFAIVAEGALVPACGWYWWTTFDGVKKECKLTLPSSPESFLEQLEEI